MTGSKTSPLHFDDWGAVTGAWVENLDDGDSWGIVKKVNNNKLKLEDDLQDGINNEFVAGDRYRVHIPSQTTSTTTPLTADGASSNETLVDNDQDFIVLGVEVGDTIYNVDDKRMGPDNRGGYRHATSSGHGFRWRRGILHPV